MSLINRITAYKGNVLNCIPYNLYVRSYYVLINTSGEALFCRETRIWKFSNLIHLLDNILLVTTYYRY